MQMEESEEIKILVQEALIILKRIDERTNIHSSDLHDISKNMQVMEKIDSNIERIANTLEGVSKAAQDITDKAVSVLSGKGVVSLKSHLLTMSVIGMMFIITIIAITKTNFTAETAGGSKASVVSH